eukprot:gene2040-18217_t
MHTLAKPAALTVSRSSRLTAPNAKPVQTVPSIFCQAPLSRNRLVTCQGLFGLGLPEVALCVGVAAMVFGPSKLLPELGRSTGKTIKGFQDAVNEFKDEMGDQEAEAAKAVEEKQEEGKKEEPKKEEAKKE